MISYYNIKAVLLHAKEAQKGDRCTALSTVDTSAKMGRWSASCPGHFSPDKETWYPLHRKLGGLWGSLSISLPMGFKRIIQSVVRHYTNYTT